MARVDDYDDYDGDEGGACGPCVSRAGGLLLAVLGGGLLWMGADLLTGGAVTRMAFGGPREDPGEVDDDDGRVADDNGVTSGTEDAQDGSDQA